MKTSKLGFASIIILLVSILAYQYFTKSANTRIAFIELNKVFVDFKMKKELEAKMKVVEEKRSAILDSLRIELKILARQIESEKQADKNKLALFSVKEENFYAREKEFSEDNIAIAKKYDEEIFSQINQYVKDFGIKNEYTAILGADGSGTLMFAKESINVTEEVKSYIDERYNGKGK